MNPEQPDPHKPVAYDAEGRPLYAAPQTGATSQEQAQQAPDSEQTGSSNQQTAQPEYSSHVTNAPERHDGHNFDPRMRVQYSNEPRVVHNPRAYEPDVGEIGPELARKHEESVKRYPHLNLSAAEYVILSIKRHPIGLWIPMGTTLALILLLMTALIAYPIVMEQDNAGVTPGLIPITVMLLCMIVVVGIGGYVAVWVYLRNTFFLTNESVIQEIQHSVFSRHEQTVSLGSIEDASFRQTGLLQTTLNYGSIRLSTEGEETTYRFQYVSNPREQIAVLNNAVEAFKNGRPVGD